jgi:hypothetical protein
MNDHPPSFVAERVKLKQAVGKRDAIIDDIESMLKDADAAMKAGRTTYAAERIDDALHRIRTSR